MKELISRNNIIKSVMVLAVYLLVYLMMNAGIH